jgi:hypothetical protein
MRRSRGDETSGEGETDEIELAHGSYAFSTPERVRSPITSTAILPVICSNT